MAEELNTLDPELDKLEKLHAEKQEQSTEDTEDVEDLDEVKQLRETSTLLRNTAILLEYLSNPDFCRTITKKERIALDKHADKIWTCVIKLDATIAELDGEDDEDEDEDI